MLLVIAGAVLLLGTSAVVIAISLPKRVTTVHASPQSELPATDDERDESKKSQKKSAKPTTAARRLDGMIVSTEDANNVPQCVMIENAAFGGVRPQSGLSRALVVYEVIVEGGITRLMAVYGGEHSDRVGPIRSARDTYLEFTAELNCAYVHAGGSDTALAALENLRLRRVDALIEYRYFWRDSGFFAPHNLFTSTDNLNAAVDNHGWTREEAPSFTPWTFQEPIEESQRASADSALGVSTVKIGFGRSYDVEYTYNAEQNTFERKNGGVIQTDAVNGEVISAKNVIVQHVGDGIPIAGKGRINWPVTGEGAVEVFHDGQVYTGRWKKDNRSSRTLFFTDHGQPLPLVQGNTWVEIVPPHITVEYE